MSPLVQAIAVRRSGSHEEVVTAVARASVLAYVASPERPEWESWLAGPFTKTVRRGTNAQVTAVAARAASEVSVGGALAHGFVPASYEEMDPALRKMQVGSFERERTGCWPEGDAGPLLAVSPDVPMTTGKAAAQVAHGLFGWYLTLEDPERAAWVAQGAPFRVVGPDQRRFRDLVSQAIVRIEDAGFTEVPSGSLTVVVTNGPLVVTPR